VISNSAPSREGCGCLRTLKNPPEPEQPDSGKKGVEHGNPQDLSLELMPAGCSKRKTRLATLSGLRVFMTRGLPVGNAKGRIGLFLNLAEKSIIFAEKDFPPNTSGRILFPKENRR
jgi:hypothetical protein